jgi:glycosyltransferase involved in cell wall biosynthesis
VLEAMACWIPVILGSTRYDYVNWFVNEKNVLMVRGDPESIANSIIRITSDDELKRKLVNNAFEHVKKYHNSSNTKIHFTEIVRGLLSNNK